MWEGASPLPHLDLHRSDRPHSVFALALRRGLIANLILQAERGQKCGRGLAPDGGESVMHVVADRLLSGASPLPHLDLYGSDRPHSVFALALRRDLIANLILQAERDQKCGRGLAPDRGGAVMHIVADTLLSGASPLPHLDLHGSDRPHSVFALALRRGLIANLILQAERGQKCERGLAPDRGESVMHVVADTLLSGASPLSHLDLYGSDRPHSVFALALRRGLIANLILEAERGQKCGRGQAPSHIWISMGQIDLVLYLLLLLGAAL